MNDSQDCRNTSEQENNITSSNIIEIKQLCSILKYSMEQLDFISVAAADARRKLLKCKKILKPRTCPCDCMCICRCCNDLDTSLRDIQEIVQACNFSNHISAIENTICDLHSAYQSYKDTHGDEWDI